MIPAADDWTTGRKWNERFDQSSEVINDTVIAASNNVTKAVKRTERVMTEEAEKKNQFACISKSSRCF